MRNTHSWQQGEESMELGLIHASSDCAVHIASYVVPSSNVPCRYLRSSLHGTISSTRSHLFWWIIYGHVKTVVQVLPPSSPIPGKQPQLSQPCRYISLKEKETMQFLAWPCLYLLLPVYVCMKWNVRCRL